MEYILEELKESIEFGKINLASPFPPHMSGMPGADELCKMALEQNILPNTILKDALIPGMSRIGEKFTRGTVFVPQMLMSAKAMKAAMIHLRPYFNSGEIKRKGVFVIGTVFG